ncbi:DUF6173 family protein [Neptunicoccus cionae]|uniref:DUF6173 family protein n=1 Tax=Neptunicoccus cionae TaxID=2035344 RepID=UPI000C75C253|nr:DUF6173 family protein [Amylibacter cionae]PLS23287.1 hypothetical protein C0U40_03935 [Amylibacter cionae]
MDNKIKTTAEALESSALWELYSAQVDRDGQTKTENQVVSSGEGGQKSRPKSEAEWAYERIVMYIQKFEETLDSDQEVGMGFVGGDVGTLRIQGMGFFAPDLITFYGAAPNGSKTQLVQHVSQLNVMLVAAPKEDEQAEPQRIGFRLAAKLNEKWDEPVL